MQTAVISSVTHITTTEQFTELSSHGLVVIDYGAKWCGPCRRIAPQFDSLAKQYPNISFLKIDVDDTPQLCNGVQCLPTFLFMCDGLLIQSLTVVGAAVDRLRLNLQTFAEGKFEKPIPVAPATVDPTPESQTLDEGEDSTDEGRDSAKPTDVEEADEDEDDD